MKPLLALFLVVLSAGLAEGQIQASGVVTVFATPSGSCPYNSPLRYDAPASLLYGCLLANSTALTGTWTQMSGGSVTSISTTGPITGGPITGIGTISCPTCATLATGGVWTVTGNDIFNSNSGNVGVGGAPSSQPSGGNQLWVFGDSTLNNAIANQFSYSYFVQKRGRTGDATATPASGSELGNFVAQGWNGSAYSNTAGGIGIVADQDWTGMNNGTRIQFYTTPDNVSANAAYHAVLTSGGNFGILSGQVFGISSSTSDPSLIDTCLGRNATGVFEINNCTLGTFRDLKARNETLSGLAGGGTVCVHVDNTGLLGTAAADCNAGGGGGTVTSVSFTGGLISVATPTTTPALTVAGTSGGIPYFSSASTWASSSLLTANAPVIGGGAGTAPSVGTRSGNTTEFGTVSGALTSGNCLKSDVNGNIVDAGGSACGGGPAGTTSQWQYNNGGVFGALTGTSSIPTAGWTIRNSAQFNNFSSAFLAIRAADAATNNIRGVTRALPAGNTYTVAWTIRCFIDKPQISAQACQAGLSDGTIYENYEILGQSGVSAPLALRIQNWTNVTTAGTTPFGPTINLTPETGSFCVTEDNTHRTWFHYANGAWVQDLQLNTGTTLTPTLLYFGAISVVNVNTSDAVTELIYLFTSTGTTCPTG